MHVQSQKIDRLSFQLGYGVNYFKMVDLNTAFSNGFLENELEMDDFEIKTGNSFEFNLLYQSIKLFDFGVYAGYQYTIKNSTPSSYKMNEFNLPIEECEGRYELRTEALTIGITNSWYIDQIVNNVEKDNFLNRLRYGVELSAGIGFSKIISNLLPAKGAVNQSEYFAYTSSDFQSQIGLKAEYDLTTTPIITSLGLRVGYQFLKTGEVRDAANQVWNVNDQYPITLDFSGVYFGVYIKIGK
ncbi:hypothetical protein DIT68_13490 [Brumimicrobium oceani]|uniref:Outer membrane protein beta-barrel domain-containing protein n=2 Tax=Brumimicrobium oceani TaxID=2100725 RepID=A0A2U2X536_9FLAO|nr:hypothetical protein DIT68_13490 [Brumimicrobium oceani]